MAKLTEKQAQELTRLVDDYASKASKVLSTAIYDGANNRKSLQAEGDAYKAVIRWILQNSHGNDPLGTKLGKKATADD